MKNKCLNVDCCMGDTCTECFHDQPSAASAGSVTEIVYTWPDGREEVRYRKPKNSVEALAMVAEVVDLQRKHGGDCPYSYRHV